MGVLALAAPGLADVPAGSVTTQPVTSGQAYPTVPAHGTGWFDVGGFCKMVQVGDLSWANPPAKAVPVFIPGTAAQWSVWRAALINSPGRYQGQVTLTTCCRPQGGIATLCAGTANPVQVYRQYGFVGEADSVTATCTGLYGAYTDQVTVSCVGSNAPDGQASWQAGGDSRSCTANAQTVYSGCSAGCGNGKKLRTVYDSCGQVQSRTYDGPSCNLGDCCTPNWQLQDQGCSATACGTTGSEVYLRVDTNGCSGSSSIQYGGACSAAACTPPPPTTTTYYAACKPQWCGPGTPGTGYACDCNYWPFGQAGIGPQTGDNLIRADTYSTNSDSDPWYWNTTGNPGPGNGSVVMPQPCTGVGCDVRPPYENNPHCTSNVTSGVIESTGASCAPYSQDCAPTSSTVTCTQ